MPEINLLPDELRGKEEKELDSARKKPKDVSVSMSAPEKEKINQPLKTPRSSVLSRLFAKKITEPLSELPKQERVAEDEYATNKSKEFHIPDFDKESQESKVIKETKEEEKEKVIFDERNPEPKKPSRKFNFNILGIFNKKDGVKKKLSFGGDEDDTFDVNLIPAELARYPEVELPKIYANSGSIIFVSILLVVISYLGITWYQNNIAKRIENIQNQIFTLDEEIAKFDQVKLEALEIQAKLKLVKQLLNNHVYWTEFFAMLEKYTIPDVYYLNFSMAGRDRVVLSAVGKDYTAVATQLVAFEKATDFIKNVKIDSAGAEITQIESEEEGVDPENVLAGVRFSITLDFMPDVFLKSVE